MMNNVFRSIVAGTALAMALAGCQRSESPAAAKDGTPLNAITTTAPVQPIAKGDPSAADAATTFAARDAADGTKTTLDTTALQQKQAPQEAMTKAEESKAMPLPSQANDHSTTALDKSKGG